ncbi:MAG: VWA domain-containing protein [Pseudomonadota bacterium]
MIGHRWVVLCGLALAAALGLSGCDNKSTPGAAGAGTTPPAGGEFSVLAGSELRDIEPTLLKAASEAGVRLKLSYAGTLDIVERVNAGERFDAILPPNGAYPALALATKPLAREKLFYSRVALGVKPAVVRSLGWDQRPPNWADIAKASGAGQLRFAMTNPTSSNTGMSALFAVASAVAGKTEDLSVSEIDATVLKAFLSGQKLTAGSSGWLADAFVKEAATLDAMVSYEAVILRTNEKLPTEHRLALVYPRDGVISADYPLMLLEASRRADHDKLVAAIKAPAVQRQLASADFLRPAIPEVPLSAGLSAVSVAELSFPNRLEVIDAVLAAYQGEWRRPATSIFVLDVSGSMSGPRMVAMSDALKVLAGADARSATARLTRFQNRERVVLLSFSDDVAAPVKVNFETAALPAARAEVSAYADALRPLGGTGIYAALLKAQELAAQERRDNPGRFVSIVLLTDGENNRSPNLSAFRTQLAGTQSSRVFPILFGEANQAEMGELAQMTGGRVFDSRKASLAQVFKEIRGYQ